MGRGYAFGPLQYKQKPPMCILLMHAHQLHLRGTDVIMAFVWMLNGIIFYACMYVHMCVRTYVCTYVRMYVRVCVCTYVCAYVRTYVRMYVRTYVRMYVRTYVRMCVYMYVRTVVYASVI